jgi:hypothetical protein
VNTEQILLDLLDHLRKTDEQKGVQGETLSEKNIIQNNNSDPNKKTSSTLSSAEERRTISIAKILAKTFFEVKKKNTKDTTLKTSVQRITPSSKIEKSKNFVDGKKEQSKWWLLFAAIGTLLTGLITDGPFKGIFKILSKMGFKILSKIFKGGVLGKIVDFFGGIVKNFSDDFLKGFKSVASKPFSNIGKIFKGGGILSKMGKFLKPLLPALRKAPLLGNIISIGFAISRFMQGDITGGVIDTLSALSGLLYPVAPPLAYGLSIGLDVLNAFLDVKQSSPENKGKGKGQILWEMTKSLGSYIWEKSYNIPILGGVRRFMDAYDMFKSGNIVGGLKKVGTGIIALTGLAPLATGLEMLMGFFSNDDKKEVTMKANTSWMKKVKQFITDKMSKLPFFLRKPLEWLGILKDTGSNPDTDVVNNTPKNGLFDNLYNMVTKSFGVILEESASLITTISEKISKIINFEKIDSFIQNFEKGISKNFSDIEKRLEKIDIIKFYKNKFDENISPKNWEKIKITNDNPKPIINISNKIKGLEEMADVNYDQLKVLEDLRNINAQTLKVMADISKQNGKPQNVSVPNPTSSDRISKGGNPVKMKISRDDYGYSPYALV